MNDLEKKINLAKSLHVSGKISEAQAIYFDLSKNEKNNNQLFFLLGTTFLQQKKYEEAISFFKKSISLDPNFPNVYNNLGIALAETKNFAKAKINYDKAIKLNKNYFDAYHNRGISLYRLKKYEEAIRDFQLVIKFTPTNSKVYNSLGNVYKNLKRYPEALNYYEKAIQINPNFSEAINNKSVVFYIQKNYLESLKCLDRLFQIDPKFKNLIENIIVNKMEIFDWNDLDKYIQIIKRQFKQNEFIFEPLFLHYIFDDPALHKKNAKNYINQEIKYISQKKSKIKKYKNEKIKIGYFSADYRNHPVLHTMRKIFRSHNRSNFEIYAFSFEKETSSNIWKKDVKHYFKDFFSVGDMSDSEIREIAINKKIDLAVDLTGLTNNGRPTLFFNRVAPVQISYLGYTGTSGNSEMDYIIADRIVIPENEQKNYTEEVLYLPHCYISSGENVALKDSNKKLKRSDFFLPENHVVYCAFHNPLKINPKLFHSWINILKKVDNSVLWIKVNNKISRQNLELEAKKRNIDSKRIVFTEREEDINLHLEKLKLADIFLDTYPYNSHSTVYDNIKAELPMIIQKGKIFSSRVGASIYSSFGMGELVAKNRKEYENIAIDIGQNYSKLKKIKEKIKINSDKFKLFDNEKITNELEKIYKSLI